MSIMHLDSIRFFGEKLVRPECVLATAAGNLYISDFRGGITQISPSGEHTFFGGADVLGIGKLKPNGIALLSDGHFLAAHLGDTQGGIYKVTRDNNITPWLTHIDGTPLPPSNFIYLDHQGRLWGTVSTTVTPRAKAYRPDIQDGFIFVVDEDGARIVADGLGYTNELYVTPDGTTLFVNATFSRELWRFDINTRHDLSNKFLLTRFDCGEFPDGLTMDTEGHLWITSIVSNRVLRVAPDTGRYQIMLEDSERFHVKWVEEAYQNKTMGREHLDQAKSRLLKNISSLAFSGKDQRTISLGCLLGESIAQIQTDYQGLPPAHWHFDN